jgi:hypothetical protein
VDDGCHRHTATSQSSILIGTDADVSLAMRGNFEGAIKTV